MSYSDASSIKLKINPIFLDLIEDVTYINEVNFFICKIFITSWSYYKKDSNNSCTSSLPSVHLKINGYRLFVLIYSQYNIEITTKVKCNLLSW
jgi:hypothetical protein